MPKSNSQQKSTPDARTRHQQVGVKRRGAGGIAWGKDQPEGPESSRRELFKLWESKEKLTGRNTLPAVCKTKGLRNCREEPPHPRWRKEAEGRGKGQTQPQRSHPLPHCKQAPGSYLKTS